MFAPPPSYAPAVATPRSGTPRGVSMSPRHDKPNISAHSEKEMIAEARERIAHNKQKSHVKRLMASHGYGNTVNTQSLLLAAKIAKLEVPDDLLADTNHATSYDKYGAPAQINWKPFLNQLPPPELRGPGGFEESELPMLRREREAIEREAEARRAAEAAKARIAAKAQGPGAMNAAAAAVPPKEVDKWFKFLQSKMKDRFTEVRRAFRLLDEDFSGSLTHDEFRQILTMFNITSIPDVVFQRILQLIDKNGDQTITFAEFSRLTGVESIYEL